MLWDPYLAGSLEFSGWYCCPLSNEREDLELRAISLYRFRLKLEARQTSSRVYCSQYVSKNQILKTHPSPATCDFAKERDPHRKNQANLEVRALPYQIRSQVLK
jgi:hypothetical protein